MAYTTPYTFSALELLTAAKMNAIQANITYLKAGLDALEIRWVEIALNTDTALTTGDGRFRWIVPPGLNGYNLTTIVGYRYSGTGVPSIQLHNETDTQDMLSTALTIDTGEQFSTTAATPPVINTSYDDVASYDVLRVDVDGAGTATLYATLLLGFEKA